MQFDFLTLLTLRQNVLQRAQRLNQAQASSFGPSHVALLCWTQSPGASNLTGCFSGSVI